VVRAVWGADAMSAKITHDDLVAASKLVGAWHLSKAAYFGDGKGDALTDVVAQAIADARAAGALHQRRIDAAHAFDRCEQYQESSGCYEAVNQVAISIARGSANEADQHGEFEPELMARVDRIAARAKR